MIIDIELELKIHILPPSPASQSTNREFIFGFFNLKILNKADNSKK